MCIGTVHPVTSRKPLPVYSSLARACTPGFAAQFQIVISLVPVPARGQLEGRRNRIECLFEDTSDPGEPGAVTATQVQEILRAALPVEGSMLVHCQYGQSRSAAVALGLACAVGWAPRDAAMDLSRAAERAGHFYPNRLVAQLFDQALGMNGELLQEAEKWRL
jgi:predicted protein tyrosine phosphatase